MPLSLAKRVRFRAELWLAARLLPFQVAGKSFEDVLAVVPSQPNRLYSGLPADYISRAVRKATRNPILMRDRKCLRQGLLAFGYMAQAGLKPELRFGIKPDLAERCGARRALLGVHRQCAGAERQGSGHGDHPRPSCVTAMQMERGDSPISAGRACAADRGRQRGRDRASRRPSSVRCAPGSKERRTFASA